MFTLADLVRVTGAKRRSVQLWADAGVVTAEHDTERMGSGVHRSFSRDEVIICAIVTQFSSMNLPIGRLVNIGRILRKNLNENQGFRIVVEHIIAGKAMAVLTISDKYTMHIVEPLYDGGANNNWYQYIDSECVPPFSGLNENDDSFIAVYLNKSLTKLKDLIGSI